MRRPLALTLSLAAGLALAAPPPHPAYRAPQTPFPSEAECIALYPKMVPAPFGPGETLDFDVDAMGAKAGSMTMTTLPLKDGLWPLEINVATNTFFSKIRRVTGTALSQLSPRTLRSQHYLEDASEHETHRIAQVTFKKPRLSRLTSTIDGRTYTENMLHGPDVTDVGGVVHLLRAVDFREGQRLCMDVYGIRRIWRVWGTVRPREQVSTGLGEFAAWHLAGEAAPLTLPDARREVHVWLSDDARRLPLAAMGVLDLGAVRATLKAVSRPGEKTSRVDNKADIKW